MGVAPQVLAAGQVALTALSHPLHASPGGSKSPPQSQWSISEGLSEKRQANPSRSRIQ